MRARGAKATDIAILVVAADDGVMPQTVEAINHARAATCRSWWRSTRSTRRRRPRKIPAQLTEYNLVAEDFGGDTMFVDISAKNGTNIEALEAVLLTADAALNLRANPDMEAQGVAIGAHLDRSPQPGGDRADPARHAASVTPVVAGDATDVSAGWSTSTAGTSKALPSRPVQVIGFVGARCRRQLPWLSTGTASPARSRTGAARVKRNAQPPAVASGSAWKTWIRR